MSWDIFTCISGKNVHVLVNINSILEPLERNLIKNFVNAVKYLVKYLLRISLQGSDLEKNKNKLRILLASGFEN